MTIEAKKQIEQATGNRLWFVQPIYAIIMIVSVLIGIGVIYGSSQSRLSTVETKQHDVEQRIQTLEEQQLITNEIKFNLKRFMEDNGTKYVTIGQSK